MTGLRAAKRSNKSLSHLSDVVHGDANFAKPLGERTEASRDAGAFARGLLSTVGESPVGRQRHGSVR